MSNTNPESNSGDFGDEYDLQEGDSLIVAGQVVTIVSVKDGEVVLELSDGFPFDSDPQEPFGGTRPPR